MARLNNRRIIELSLKDLEIGGAQPRKFFNEKTLRELASSLKEIGSLQPIIARPKGKKYEVIIGARRLKAAQMAGFDKISTYIVRGIDDSKALEIALTENIQREDLTPFEEAWAILKLMKKHDFGTKDLCRKLGKSENFVRSRLLLLQLPASIQKYVAEGEIGIETAASLTRLSSSAEQIKIAEEIIVDSLPTRQVKQLILERIEKNAKEQQKKIKKETPFQQVERQVRILRRLLSRLECADLSPIEKKDIRFVLVSLKEVIDKTIMEIDK